VFPLLLKPLIILLPRKNAKKSAKKNCKKMKKFDPKQLGKAPAGYIPGVSRGTNGFMTRSDIGPMMTDVSMGLNMTRNQT
jgi:hypothetical protein